MFLLPGRFATAWEKNYAMGTSPLSWSSAALCVLNSEFWRFLNLFVLQRIQSDLYKQKSSKVLQCCNLCPQDEQLLSVKKKKWVKRELWAVLCWISPGLITKCCSSDNGSWKLVVQMLKDETFHNFLCEMPQWDFWGARIYNPFWYQVFTSIRHLIYFIVYISALMSASEWNLKVPWLGLHKNCCHSESWAKIQRATAIQFSARC